MHSRKKLFEMGSFGVTKKIKTKAKELSQMQASIASTLQVVEPEALQVVEPEALQAVEPLATRP